MTEALAVGYHGYTAEMLSSGVEYVGVVSTFKIRAANDTLVGYVKVTDGTTVRATATLADGTRVTNEWLDLFNSDAGDRDINSGLDRAANAIADAVTE